MMIDDLRAAAEADVVLIHFNYNFSKMLHSRNQPLMHKSRVQRITAYINKSRLTFQTSLEMTKRLYHIILLFSR